MAPGLEDQRIPPSHFTEEDPPSERELPQSTQAGSSRREDRRESAAPGLFMSMKRMVKWPPAQRLWKGSVSAGRCWKRWNNLSKVKQLLSGIYVSTMWIALSWLSGPSLSFLNPKLCVVWLDLGSDFKCKRKWGRSGLGTRTLVFREPLKMRFEVIG